ncbi:MAG TPA: DUF192 domain-containing protein [Bryobacteraceae bacterium]|nr:DUF192 domain-containing protein [Bryobacteraceae bacterium]
MDRNISHEGGLNKVLSKIRVRNVTRGTLLADGADVADTSAKRRTGLLQHQGLRTGEGLWIVPCEAVHTFGMTFEIDVVYLSKTKKVVKIREKMPRRRISACLWAHSVLELPPGMTRTASTQVGDQLEFEKLA